MSVDLLDENKSSSVKKRNMWESEELNSTGATQSDPPINKDKIYSSL